MTRRDRPLLALGFGVLGLFFVDLWGDRTFFARDLTLLFHPMHTFTAQALQGGGLPLWNPFVSGGVYWIGQPQTGVFSPGNLFFWLLPFVPGLKLFHLFHLGISALGGYLLARTGGGSRGRALAAAFLWSLNGFWVSRLEFPPLLGVLAWTPWVLLFVARGRGSRVAVGGGMGAVALALLAGHWPHVVWMSVLAGVATVSGSERIRRGKTLALALIGGACMAAVQVLPGVDLVRQSDRTVSGLTSAVADRFSLSLGQWAGVLSPLFSDFPLDRYTGERFYWLGCFFVGTTALALAARAWGQAPARARWAWGGLFLFGATQSLGPTSPLYRFLFAHAPVFNGVRYPAQYTYWMVTAVAAVISLHGRDRGSRPLQWGILAFLLGELFFWGFRLAPTLPGRYFDSKPSWVAPLQESGGRLFLSPRAVSNVSVRGNTPEETWTLYRHQLLSLGTAPYRLENLNPIGFSLNPAPNERVLSALYGAPSPAAARALWDRLGVRWVASPGPLDLPGARFRGQGPWNLYERTDGGEGLPPGWKKESPRWDTRRFTGPSGAVVLPTGEFFVPGWSAGAREGARRLEGREDMAALIPAEGDTFLWMRFRPASARGGLAVSLVALGGLVAFGTLALQKGKIL